MEEYLKDKNERLEEENSNLLNRLRIIEMENKKLKEENQSLKSQNKELKVELKKEQKEDLEYLQKFSKEWTEREKEFQELWEGVMKHVEKRVFGEERKQLDEEILSSQIEIPPKSPPK